MNEDTCQNDSSDVCQDDAKDIRQDDAKAVFQDGNESTRPCSAKDICQGGNQNASQGNNGEGHVPQTVEEKKAALRAAIRPVLRNVCSNKYKVKAESFSVHEYLMHSPMWKNAPAIFLYMNTPFEIETEYLIECAIRQGHRVALPRVRATCITWRAQIPDEKPPADMDFYYIDGICSADELNIRHRKRGNLPKLINKMIRKRSFGIREPFSTLPMASTLEKDTLIVVPGMAFSADGWRLGHGGGYYDRYIAAMRQKTGDAFHTAGVCFSCQLLDDVPHDDMDERMDAVFSPYKVCTH